MIRAVSPRSACSCETTLAAVEKSSTRATSSATRAKASQPTRIERVTATVARNDAGTRGTQTAARPLPRAIAGTPTSPAISTDQTRTRPVLGWVAWVVVSAAVTTATTAYPSPKSPVASGTVQSRSPSAIRAASGPCPETDSPTRWPIRQADQAARSVSPRGTAVIRTPSTVTPAPCAASQVSAPVRRAPLGLPCPPASVRNQPTTARARHTSSGPPAAIAPPTVAVGTIGRRVDSSRRTSAAERSRDEDRESFRDRAGGDWSDVMASSIARGDRRQGQARRLPVDTPVEVRWSGHGRGR